MIHLLCDETPEKDVHCKNTHHVSKALLQPLWCGRPWLKGPVDKIVVCGISFQTCQMPALYQRELVMRLNSQLSYKLDLGRIILFDHNLGLILEGLAIIFVCLIRSGSSAG